jgi:hypothetical protein
VPAGTVRLQIGHVYGKPAGALVSRDYVAVVHSSWRAGEFPWINPGGIPVWEWGTAPRTVNSGLVVRSSRPSQHAHPCTGGSVGTGSDSPDSAEAGAARFPPPRTATARRPEDPREVVARVSGWRDRVPIPLPERPSSRAEEGTR